MDMPVQIDKILIAGKQFELFVPEAKAIREAFRLGKIDSPYWSQVWPAAMALSEFICRNPALVRQKKVLELGAGLGLPSIIAAEQASSVLCTDISAEAMGIVDKTVAYHSLSNLKTAVFAWQNLPADLVVDTLLLSDVNYDASSFSTLRKLIQSFLAKAVTIVLSTPQRVMAREFVASLQSFCKEQQEIKIVHAGAEVPVTIMVLRSEQ